MFAISNISVRFMSRTKSVNFTALFLPVLLFLIPSLPLNAVVTKWVIRPQFKTIYHYCGDYYKCRLADGTARIISAENGKGITDNAGLDFILEQADSLTYPVNGYALVITPSYSGDSVLKGILDFDAGKVVPVIANSYFVTKSGFFSQNLLCVKNKKGKFGYLGTDGKEVIKCQFQQAHPFREGFASVVQKGYYAMYITRTWDYDHTPLVISFRNGDIAFASSFKDGTAVVGYDNDCAYVDRRGNVTGTYTPSSSGIFVDEYDYSISSGLTKSVAPARYMDGRKRTVEPNLPEQTCSFSAFYDDRSVARDVSGKCGIVQLCPGEIDVRLKETVIPVRIGEQPQVVFTVSGGEYAEDLTLSLVCAGERKELALKNGWAEMGVLSGQEGENVLTYEVLSDGLVQARGECNYELVYPLSFILDSVPHPVGDCANADDIQNVAAKFTNNTAIAKTAVVTLSILPTDMGASPVSVSRNVNIASGESYTIICGVTVKKDISVNAKLTVSVDGQNILSAKKEMTLKSFY